MQISHEFCLKTKTDIAVIVHTGLQFPGLVYNLEGTPTLHDVAKSRLNPAGRPKCAISHSSYLFIYLYFWGGGGGAKLSLMIATLKKKRTKHPPPPIHSDYIDSAQMKLETMLKYHQWYLCQSRSHAIICLYYHLQKVCNFHIQVFQMKLNALNQSNCRNFSCSSIKLLIKSLPGTD